MLTILLLLLTAALTTVYFYFHLTVFQQWKRLGFPYVQPSFPFGNLGDVMARKVSFGVHMFEIYKKSTAPLVEGIYFFFRPALVVTNAELATRVLVEDFDSFHDRGNFYNPDVDPMSSHLFNLPGNEWKSLRSKLTPTFTTGKLKSMMSTILVEGEVLKKYLDPLAEKNEIVPMKDLLDR